MLEGVILYEEANGCTGGRRSIVLERMDRAGAPQRRGCGVVRGAALHGTRSEASRVIDSRCLPHNTKQL